MNIWFNAALERYRFNTSKGNLATEDLFDLSMEDLDLAKLTKEEEEILMLTEEIWNRFLALPINHPMEANEIAMKIHDIQRMIISRPGFRMNQEMFRQYGNG